VAVTFHPRFLLAQPEPSRSQLKQAAWQDLQMIQRRLRQLTGTRG
jgi:uracil-DNA glycosylase